MPPDAAFIQSRCHGFSGASSMERLPAEQALVAQTRSVKAMRREPQGNRIWE